jgi:hypothetical protein
VKNRTVRVSVVVLAFVLAIALSPSARAQSFTKVSVQGNAKMKQVASGGMSVWALATNGHPYIYKNGKFVLTNTISLAQIAVGGGNLRQPDTVWGLDSANNIYRASKSGTSWVFTQMPGSLDFIAVGIGYQDPCHPYEVWGLNLDANIYRYNFCIQNWDYVPGTLATLAVGGGNVAGFNGNLDVYWFDYPSMSFMQLHARATAVAVGPDGVWVFLNQQLLDIISPSQFSALSSLPLLTQIQAGGNGVWGIDASGLVYLLRLGGYDLVQIPNILLASISVGSGGGVWGIDPSGQVFAFSTQ